MIENRPRRIRTDVPTLWERAKAMLAAMRDAFALARDFSLGPFSRRERRRLSDNLKPLEAIVRTLMVTEAVIFLLMTEEGRRLCRETRRIEPPAPPAPPAAACAQQALLPPGWHTIAAMRPVIDPRVVAREQREALERHAAAGERLSRLMSAIADPATTDSLSADFRILRWTHDSYPELDPALPAKRAAYDPAWPILPSMLPAARKELAAPTPPRDGSAPDRDLARRFAALIGVLANPAPPIRRLAETLAALPRDCLPLLGRGRMSARREADPDLLAARRLGRNVLSAYTRADRSLRPPEPG